MLWISFENEDQLNAFIHHLDESGVGYHKNQFLNKHGVSVIPSEPVARTLLEHIRKYYEKKLIDDIYQREYYPFFKTLDEKRICEIGKRLSLEDSGIDETLKKELMPVLSENDIVFVKGLTDFRLLSYKTALEENVEKSFEEYAREKEMESFVELLQYFIRIQEPQCRLLHIVVKQAGDYRIINEQYQELHYEQIAQFQEELFEEVSSPEDRLLSILITIVPQQIIFHDESNNTPAEFLKTIKSVFEKRFSLCRGCSYCKNFLLKN